MSEISCPVSRSRGRSMCPAGKSQSVLRGCAWAGNRDSSTSSRTSMNSIDRARLEDTLRTQERKTINELLLPEAPSRQITQGLKNADSLNPPDLDVLAAALGSPARGVLVRAMEIGPQTGWKDGYLTSTHGFCPPDPSASPIALSLSEGRVWSDLCERMPGVVARGKVRESILSLPLVYGTPDTIPDEALWAATVCLGILASVYRYEEVNDGNEGISVAPPPGTFRNLSGEADDEEEETKGIPRNVAIPLRQICTRMGRVLPHLTQFDVSIYNYKLRDHTSIHPYLPRCENMDLRWPVFKDRGEAMFLLCMAESHGCFIPGVELITRCQEMVMLKDEEGLLRELVKLKEIVDQLPHVFQKISVNPNSGENFANPVEWGQRYAKFSAPLSRRVPALSGLALPLFLLMDAFMGRTKYDSFLGLEALHLRAWLPMNIRAFIAAVEYKYQVPAFVKASNNPRLKGVLDGLVESYMGERGWMGTHRYKVYGFLEVVAKTGRSETNGNSGSTAQDGRPWEEVHKSLSESMKERLDPYRGSIDLQPHQLRGTFQECRFKARIMSRQSIDSDPSRSTGMVTFDLQDTGITFRPGDRLAVMPLNSWAEVAKMTAALGLEEFIDQHVPIGKSVDWTRFSNHLGSVSRVPSVQLTVRDILRRGHIAPLTKELVMAFHLALHASSSTILQVLASEEWPVKGTLGDLLQLAVAEVKPSTWDQAFDLSDLSWLSKLIPVEVPRTYSIASYTDELLPSTIDLTVSRSDYQVAPALSMPGESTLRHGVSSGFLNPDVSHISNINDSEHDELLIGVSRPLNFQLPVSMTVPIAMFAGGSGIAPFRGFWQSRTRSGFGRNILFLGAQSREKLPYEDELRDYVRHGFLEVHTAFSRDKTGLVFDPVAKDLVPKQMEPRYIDTTIIEQGRTVCDLVISKSRGGLGGYLYICGSVSVYETIMSGIRQALYANWTSTKESAEILLSQAFAERRFMLDIFMTPQSVPYTLPTISRSQLAQNTGHRPNSRMWIGVHGFVYDITDFLPMHPGGTLIVAASAGLDASKTFDDLAHTNNPEVSSLLSKYLIGHLASKPDLELPESSELYDTWYQYLRTCVESLTTLHFEVKNIMEDAKVWFSEGLFNMGGVRKFYQFQSRLMQNGFTIMFGAKLQEIYLRLSYAVVNSGMVDRLPDVVGIVTRAQSSPASAIASNEIAQIGQFVCNSHGAQFQENGILKFAQAVTQLDVEFLEEILQEVCVGMDGFEAVGEMPGASEKQRMIKLSLYLLSVLERIAKRLETFYSRLSAYSIYTPILEKNPARTRWNLLRRKIKDGSFFILTEDLQFHASDISSPKAFRSFTHQDPNINFQYAISQVKQAIDIEPQSVLLDPIHSSNAPLRLADRHMSRATPNSHGPSSFEQHEQKHAMNRMSIFMDNNMQSIKRLSQLPSNIDFAHIMSIYGTKEKGRKQTQSSTSTDEEINAITRTLSRRKVQQSTSQPPNRSRQPLSTHSRFQVTGTHPHQHRPETKVSDFTFPPFQRQTSSSPHNQIIHSRPTLRSRSTSTSSTNTSSYSRRMPVIPSPPTTGSSSAFHSPSHPITTQHHHHHQPQYQSPHQNSPSLYQPPPLHNRRQMSGPPTPTTSSFIPSPSSNGGLTPRRKASSLSGLQQGRQERKMVFPVIASGLV